MGHLHNEILLGYKIPFTTVGVDLESIMLSEISQSDKDKYHMISLICGIKQIELSRKMGTDS